MNILEIINKNIKMRKSNSNKNIPLLILLGPTAVGKTDLSIELAKLLNTEIISADSMQIYKDMNIGTAKISKNTRNKVPHHLIDIITPDKNFSVAKYKEICDKKINMIFSKNKLPFIVGGTGLYINAVVNGFMLPDMEIDKELRRNLRKKAKKHGNKYVHDILCDIDPQLADKLHPNDLRRVIRGIEIYRKTGKTKTYFKKKQEKRGERYNTIKIGLIRNREELYNRINKRVEIMLEKGLIKEVKKINNKYKLSKTAKQALGYKEILNYFNGEYDLEEAKRLIKRDSRHLAKKQISFFKRDDNINWFNLSKVNKKYVIKQTKKLIKSQFRS